MLYHLHEFQQAALNPYRAWLAAARAITNSTPAAWQTPFHGITSASLDMAERLTRHYDKPAFSGPHEIIDRHPYCHLLHFVNKSAKNLPKVLIIAPLSGHYATLLQGTVDAMMIDHDVYITDWQNARNVAPSAGPFHLDDYVHLVQHHIELLGDNTHVIAVCQPSVPVLAAVALLCEDEKTRPKTMTLMGGPVDARVSPTTVNTFAETHDINWFKANSIHSVPAPNKGAGSQVYPGFLQLSGFIKMNEGTHTKAYQDHFWDLVRGDEEPTERHRKFYDEYMSVMDLPAPYFLDTIKAVFHDFALAKGTFSVKGRVVNPAAIKDVALMTVEGELDDISGLGQTQAAHKICSSLSADQREHFVQLDVGHYGIFNGRKWREHIQPRVAAFIQKHGS